MALCLHRFHRRTLLFPDLRDVERISGLKPHCSGWCGSNMNTGGAPRAGPGSGYPRPAHRPVPAAKSRSPPGDPGYAGPQGVRTNTGRQVRCLHRALPSVRLKAAAGSRRRRRRTSAPRSPAARSDSARRIALARSTVMPGCFQAPWLSPRSQPTDTECARDGRARHRGRWSRPRARRSRRRGR